MKSATDWPAPGSVAWDELIEKMDDGDIESGFAVAIIEITRLKAHRDELVSACERIAKFSGSEESIIARAAVAKAKGGA